MLKILRYRFFLFAGIIPYLVGASIAYHESSKINLWIFLIGLLGISLCLVGVETFNEFFDLADRLFTNSEPKKASPKLFYIGVLSLSLAFVVCLYLMFKIGIVVLLFGFLGFLIAAFYVGPPLRLVYRGLGELSIFLAYGPLMTYGSYYIQTQSLDIVSPLVGVILGLLVSSLAIVNQLPDYYKDLLAKKRNIVVRFGQHGAALIFLSVIVFVYILVGLCLFFKILPFLSVFLLLTIPISIKCIKLAIKYYDNSAYIISAIRYSIILYMIFSSIFILSFSILPKPC